jgi:hypothetical protein
MNEMPRRLTLFDLDGTLLPMDSDHAFGQFLVEQGWVDGPSWGARNDQFYADYCAGRLDQEAYVEFATSGWRLRGRGEAEALRDRFMTERLVPSIQPQALQLVRRHQSRGDLVATKGCCRSQERAGPNTASTPSLLDDRAVRVVETLQDAGYEAYIVGGAVRDLLLGIGPRTSTWPPTPRPSRSRALFRRAFIIGRRFRIVHVVFGRGREHEVIEVSTFRAYLGPRRPSR